MDIDDDLHEMKDAARQELLAEEMERTRNNPSKSYEFYLGNYNLYGLSRSDFL
jgi:hypothetical protein